MTTTILTGDCRERLRELPDGSVNCCVSSPPYFGLRDYGTVTWEGGDPDHAHDRVPARGGRGGSGSPGKNIRDAYPSDLPADECSCGARKVDRQIGLEQTPEEFVASLVAVFREVRRVLRDDGTLWLNIGDTYAGSGKGAWANKDGGQKEVYIPDPDSPQTKMPKTWDGIKAKDLIGIPWMLAFALRADGWYLRQEIIWAKPNPMPESVRDRCTKAHEQIFLLSKKPRYYFDADAIKEPAECGRLRGSGPMVNSGTGRGDAQTGTVGDYRTRPSKKRGEFNGKTNDLAGREAFRAVVDERNKRSVWSVATQAFSEAHFATFPPELIEPCILAGCPAGGTVLDPFFGAGTTGLVSKRLGRDCIGIELNPEYAEIARARIRADLGQVKCDLPEKDEYGPLFAVG